MKRGTLILLMVACAAHATPPPELVTDNGEATTVLRRTLDRSPASLPFMGDYPAQRIESSVISGASSYAQTTTWAIVPGTSQRVYPDTARGIWIGQRLNVTSSPQGWAQPIEQVTVKSIGWDTALQRMYFEADFTLSHPAGAIVYQKHDVGALTIDSKSNADNQTQDLHVIRRQYGVGDSFAMSVQHRYMSDVMSGIGDEGAVGVNSEVIGELDSFHSTVEWVDGDALHFSGDGVTHPETLSTSRPIINLNAAKWITAGTVRIANHYRPLDGVVYPITASGPFRDPGGAIIASAGAGWTSAVVGRFFAVTDSAEVISPGDGAAGFAKAPERVTLRWYQIVDFEALAGGQSRIKILRVMYGAAPAGSPNLFRDDSYSWDGHERPLAYAIAPGEWVTDISDGYADLFQTGGRFNDLVHPKTLRLAPGPDRGTGFGFAPGDEIEQAVGPDPFHPVPIRVRQFHQWPGSGAGASIEVNQGGRVQVPYGMMWTGANSRKDGKPAYGTWLRLATSANMGIHFSSNLASPALYFQQPGGNIHAQTWRTDKGGRRFYADPASGNWTLVGGDVNVDGHSMLRTSGLSATGTAARNLRGIGRAVPKDAVILPVLFATPEPDASYALHVDANWYTEHKVSVKTAAGFVVEFAAPAPSGAKLDWVLVR